MALSESLGLDTDASGVRIRGLGLWLDPTRAVPLAFVSHVHAAPAAADCARVFASRETIALAALLGTPLNNAHPLEWEELIELPVERDSGGGVARIRLAPAGHMLGAAQLVVEHAGARLVYAGDWSAESDATHPGGTAIACDELVVTSAFALPLFRFESPAVVRAAVVDWCAERLAAGVTPIVLAHCPGPAQAIVHALSSRGLPVSGNDDVRKACAAYEALDVVLGPVAAHEPGTRGRAVVVSAATKATKLRKKGRVEVAYASAWAELDAAMEQKRADVGFVLADQADGEGLIALARASGAACVFSTRGDAVPFVHMLRREGIRARPLGLDAIDERAVS